VADDTNAYFFGDCTAWICVARRFAWRLYFIFARLYPPAMFATLGAMMIVVGNHGIGPDRTAAVAGSCAGLR